MGDVHLARMRAGTSDVMVALKRMRPELVENAELVRQFEREARICTLLRHDNIVALRAYGTDQGGPYLALEYVEGHSAGDLLKATAGTARPLPVVVALSIVRDAALGLRYAHELSDPGEGIEHGVIHRDISPDNILVSSSGMAKLADFGIAKVIGGTHHTRTGTVKGKFGYMAPELFEGKDATVASDLFALGATLYHLVCGVPPFQGRTEAELLRAVLHASPPRPRTLRPEVAPAIEAWMLSSLSKDAAGRTRLATLLESIDLLVPEASLARAEVAGCLDEALPGGRRLLPLSAALPQRAGTRLTAKPQREILLGFAVTSAVLLALLVALLWVRNPPPSVPHAAAVPAPTSARAAPRPDEFVPKPGPAPTAAASPDAPTPSAPRQPVVAGPRPEHARPRRQATTLWIKVDPWARVFLDGELLGVTPMAPIRVAPGAHSVILVNEELKERRTLSVKAEANQETELKVSLSAVR